MIKNNKNFIIKFIFLISIVALLFAYFVEYILGYQPCNLCLLERIPYIVDIVVILLSYKFNHFEKKSILLLTIVFLVATILSLYHLGIEKGFIEESFVCNLKSSMNLLSKDEILKQLQTKNISCKDVTFTIFGLSLTSYNIIISLLITYSTIRIYLDYDKN